MLNSRRLIGGIERRIETDRRNAESAVMAEISAIAQEFAAMEDSYLAARAEAVREVGHRIQIGRAHVCTPVTNAHLVTRLLLEKKKTPRTASSRAVNNE